MTGTLAGILFPLVQLAFDSSQSGITLPQKPALIIGQTVTPQPVNTITAISSVAQARSMYGRGSMLALMFEGYQKNDLIGPIYCMAQPASATGATKASATLTLTGPATANGTIFLMIAAQNAWTGVTSGDTANAMAANIASTINALPDLPVTAVANTGVVTITARNGGTLGNQIDLRLNYSGLAAGQALPAGVSVALTTMAGGATDPTLTSIAAAIGDFPYRFIIHPYASGAELPVFTAMMNFDTGRWSPTRKSWGHCFTATSDSFANLATYGLTNNDPHHTIFAYETASPMWEPVAAAMFCGAMAASLRKQPNQPVQSLQIQGFLGPNASGGAATQLAFNSTAWQTLLGSGLALAQYDQAGNASILRAPTTYQTNPYGQPDQSYFDTEDMYLLMAQSDFLASFFTQTYGRCMVADDGTKFGAGVPIVTPRTIKAGLVSAYQQMQQLGWVEDTDAFIAATSVQRNLTSPSEVDILFAPFQVVGLRQIAVTNQFRKFSAAAAAAVQAA